MRAAPPRNGAAEKTPSTPFPREEMAWTAMAAIHIVARILRTNVHHLNLVRRLAAQGFTFFPFLIFVKIRKIKPKALSEFW